MESVRPVLDEYKRLFVDPSGDYYAATRAFMGARVLNPLVAVNMGMEEMTDAIKDLSYFGFDEFRAGHGIIKDIIGEVPIYLAIIESTSTSFWSEVDGAEEYDAALKKKNDHNPEENMGRTWQDDRIEKARRVWEWWRTKAKKFVYFFTAARLVALVPVSSTSVERAFSQVKFIIETVGENLLEETLETRLMERVNEY